MSHRVSLGPSNSSARMGLNARMGIGFTPAQEGYRYVSHEDTEDLPAVRDPETSDTESQGHNFREHILHAVVSLKFQTVISLIIIANAILIGLETDCPDLLDYDLLETSFLLIFTVELCLRLIGFGIPEFINFNHKDFYWNMFDVFIVVLGIVAISCEFLSSDVSRFTMFRMVRLLRILRMFKIIRFHQQLYLLAHGFIEAAQSVFWVTVLMVFVHYVCAIVLVRTMGHLPETEEHHLFLTEHYGTIVKAMMSLFDLMSQPDMHPYHGMRTEFPFFTIFLMGWIIFGSFGMIALLTGVVSEGMFDKNSVRIDSERLDREKKRCSLISKLGDVFEQVPAEGRIKDSEATREQILKLLTTVEKVFDKFGIEVTQDEMQHVVDIMDADENGSISKAEFVHGLISIAESIRPMSVAELFHGVQLVKSRVAKTQTNLEGVTAQVALNQAHIERLGGQMENMIASVAQSQTHIEKLGAHMEVVVGQVEKNQSQIEKIGVHMEGVASQSAENAAQIAKLEKAIRESSSERSMHLEFKLAEVANAQFKAESSLILEKLQSIVSELSHQRGPRLDSSDNGEVTKLNACEVLTRDNIGQCT